MPRGAAPAGAARKHPVCHASATPAASASRGWEAYQLAGVRGGVRQQTVRAHVPRPARLRERQVVARAELAQRGG